MLVLGVLSLRSALRPSWLAETTGDNAPTARAAYLQGLLTNALNPKVGATGHGVVPAGGRRGGGIPAGFRRALTTDVARRALEAVTGTVLVAFGLGLAWDRR